MFLHDFHDAQKVSFLALAREVIQADSRLLASEMTLYNRLRGEMGLAPVEAPGERQPDWDALPDVFTTTREKGVVMLELQSLAYADGEVSEEEYVVLRRVARTLNIAKGQRLAMENWVVRMMRLFMEAEDLFHPPTDGD